MTLHVWHDGESEWVIATDAADAMAVWCDTVGEKPESYPDMAWEMLPDDSTMAIWINEDEETEPCGCRDRRRVYEAKMDAYNKAAAVYVGIMAKVGARFHRSFGVPVPQYEKDYGPNGHYNDCPVGHPRKTCAEWAQQDGRGYLCSTEC